MDILLSVTKPFSARIQQTFYEPPAPSASRNASDIRQPVVTGYMRVCLGGNDITLRWLSGMPVVTLR